MLVGVRPVVDLFLNEFAAGNGAERRAGEVQVVVGRDGQDVFVEVICCFAFGCFAFGLVFCLEQVFGFFAPGAVVVVVEDDAVPVGVASVSLMRLFPI